MPETKGTVEAIGQWEEYPKNLAKLGMAELVEDSNKEFIPKFDVQEKEDSLDYVRVYHIFVGSGLGQVRVVWRFHYDKRPGAKSSLRISGRGMRAIFHSMTVMSLVQKLNIAITGNNEYDFEKLQTVMEEAIKIADARKKKKLENEKKMFQEVGFKG